MYIAIDPGKRVGVAKFNDDGSDGPKVALSLEHFRMYLGSLNKEDGIKNFIVEDFRIQKNKALAFVGDDLVAARAIGSIEFVAQMLNVPIVFQGSFLLPTAIKWAGIDLKYLKKTNHLPDELSAYAHGIHYLVSNGIRKHRILGES